MCGPIQQLDAFSWVPMVRSLGAVGRSQVGDLTLKLKR
jgi:hypothetical protein